MQYLQLWSQRKVRSWGRNTNTNKGSWAGELGEGVDRLSTGVEVCAWLLVCADKKLGYLNLSFCVGQTSDTQHVIDLRCKTGWVG